MASADVKNPAAYAPTGVNHIVLNVRNMEESHAFWTEIVGLRLVGEFRQRPDRPPTPRMQFYSGTRPDGAHHHDLALVENTRLPPPPPDWKMWDMPIAINHIAITYPSREAWLQHLGRLRDKGVKFDRRIDHGMTHSVYLHDPNGYGVELVYDLPREVWEGDIEGALNFAQALPHEGAEVLIDQTEVPVFGSQ